MDRFAIRLAECPSMMPEEFDPYSQWLGILAHERPVDHYRLLGIERFTADPGAITAAADRRMALIRSYQTGPRGRFTQPLLNEIAAAKLCLINAPSKTAYDAMLEGLALATKPPPLAAPPAPPAPPESNASQPAAPPAATDHENDDRVARVVATAEAISVEDSPGLSAGSVVLAAAVLVIVGVGSYVTWQVLDARGRSRTIDPRVAVAGGPREDGGQAGREHGSPAVGSPADISPADISPVVVVQETDGSVGLTPSVAVLSGQSVHVETVGITDLLTGWASVDEAAAWKCKIVKLPPNGVFRVRVTYRAATGAEEGRFQLAINGHEKTWQVRGTGELVTDELFLPVTRTGEHTVELRPLQLPAGEFELQGIRLVMPTGNEG